MHWRGVLQQHGELVATQARDGVVLAQLPAADRRLIYLRFFQNKTQSETARALGTTQVQISRRERRLLTGLRARLAE